MPRPLYRITNPTREIVICDRAQLADTTLTRLFGLLGRNALAQGEGLLIQPSSGVHTWGMTFPIDIVSLNGHLEVVQLCPETGPWRIGGLGWRTRSVLELPAGQVERCSIALGDALAIELAC